MNPMIMNILNLALQRRPEMANNPMAKEIIQVLQNGDSKRGEELATNLCKSYGETKEQAVGHAQQFFNGMMGRR